MSSSSRGDAVPDPALDAAVKLHQAGKLDRAAQAYREILDLHPNDPNALNLLGVTELQSGRFVEAVDHISRAIQVQPNFGMFHMNLASALRALGRIDDTIAAAERAILLDESLAAQGYDVAALAFVDGGQPQDALDCWVKALKANPDFAEAHLSIAQLMDRAGNYLHSTMQQKYAEEIARQKVEREPESAAARRLLGKCLEQGGKLTEAVVEYRAATRLMPHDAIVFYDLGRALRRAGEAEEAITVLRFALRMNARLAQAHAEIGTVLLAQGRVVEAIASLRTALTLLPGQPDVRATLADALARAGDAEEAVKEARDAVAAAPNSASIRSTLLRTLLLDAHVSPRELFDEHVEWDKRHGRPLQAAVDRHITADLGFGGAGDAHEPSVLPAIDKNPDRPLRIGFISPHFRRGSLAKMLIPLLANLDRAQFQVACYSDTPTVADGEEDGVTKAFRQLSAGWRETASLSDTQLALRIREDRIDIFIDLTGHGEGNRMLAFAQKPAPVQVTQIGYPFTTGVSAIAYRVSDDLADPPSADGESLHIEKLVRLARPAICFAPLESTTPRIETRRGTEPITFGCVSNVAYFSPQTIETWAKLIAAVADSRLLVMSDTPDTEATRALLTRHGIAPFRVAVVPPESGARYFDFFNSLDVALDTFPSSGGTTAGDALWMGRPMVTLATDEMPASRGAAAFLRSAGLDGLIAATPHQYFEIAMGLANDRARLEELAGNLRAMLAQAPICDAAGCAAAMMAFYREAWRKWCAAQA